MASRRQAAKEETRTALIDAALRLFSEKGLDAPSLDAICKEAGYTRGAFYVHFDDRDDLVVAVVSRVIGAFLDTVAAQDDATDLAETIHRFVSLYRLAVAVRAVPFEQLGDVSPAVHGVRRLHLILEASERRKSVADIFVSLILEGRTRMEATIRAGQKAGTVHPGVDPEAAAGLLVTLVLGLLVEAQVGVPLQIERLENEVLRLLQPSD